MKKRFSKIYIEITNICNLNCSFCLKTNKEKRIMSLLEFEKILKEIDPYTDNIYLHVQGEPLLYKDLDSILKLCQKYNKKVSITTNGTLLKNRKDVLINNKIKQINISLHSENNDKNYYKNIFDTVKFLNNTTIIYRIWVNNKDKDIIKYLQKEYGDSVLNIYKKTNIKLDNNIYLDKQEEFIWPSINNNYTKDGTCLGLKTHLAILCDGTVVLCCLDILGNSNLGNIYKESLSNILNKDKTKEIIKCFNDNKCYLDICKHCSFKERFNDIKN